jgi:hypothetical protein
MRTVLTSLTALVAAAALCVLTPACTSERLVLELAVSANPNPVAGADETGGRVWNYDISITNPTAVGVTVKFYHAAISGTDTGYAQPLQAVSESPIVGFRIEPGVTLTYPASRSSVGNFARGRERRIFHTLGDDGKYYSGEVTIQLQ